MDSAPNLSLVFSFAAVRGLTSFDAFGCTVTPSGMMLPAVRVTLKNEAGSLSESLVPLFVRPLKSKEDIEQLREDIKLRLDGLLDNLSVTVESIHA